MDVIAKRLFVFKFPYWYRNLKYIPVYFRAKRHLLKYGYDECATWETFAWFTKTMKMILKDYRKYHIGYPVRMDNYNFGIEGQRTLEANKQTEDNEKFWDSIIDRMIELLELMDEENSIYDDMYDTKEKMQKANKTIDDSKNEFFKLFSKYFFDLWD